MTHSNLLRAGQLAILVPYRDRKTYMDVFLREVPSYLERANGISDYAIYVAEQQNDGQFNLALSRNVAAMAALDDGASGYFVFHVVSSVVMTRCGIGSGHYRRTRRPRISPEPGSTASGSIARPGYSMVGSGGSNIEPRTSSTADAAGRLADDELRF